MSFRFSQEALDEVLAARDWYEARSAGLGLAFAHAIDASALYIERNPLAYPMLQSPYRHCVVKRFPYSLIYRSQDRFILILACHHHSLHPSQYH